MPYPCLAAVAGFVCKACTVRAELERELQHHASDEVLLELERMRLIDCAHAWAPSSTNTY
eukprot:7446026-Ditylum_brightwellii.AAC.2